MSASAPVNHPETPARPQTILEDKCDKTEELNVTVQNVQESSNNTLINKAVEEQMKTEETVVNKEPIDVVGNVALKQEIVKVIKILILFI